MNIRVVDYDSQWSVKFAEESVRIRNILGDVLIDISSHREHFGCRIESKTNYRYNPCGAKHRRGRSI